MKPREGTTVMRTPLRTGLDRDRCRSVCRQRLGAGLGAADAGGAAGHTRSRRRDHHDARRHVHMPGVQVELSPTSDATVIAKTTTDGSGIVTFPDVPPGRYIDQGHAIRLRLDQFRGVRGPSQRGDAGAGRHPADVRDAGRSRCAPRRRRRPTACSRCR